MNERVNLRDFAKRALVMGNRAALVWDPTEPWPDMMGGLKLALLDVVELIQFPDEDSAWQMQLPNDATMQRIHSRLLDESVKPPDDVVGTQADGHVFMLADSWSEAEEWVLRR